MFCLKNFQICTTDYHMNPVVIVTRASQAGDEAQQSEVQKIIANRFNIPPASIYMYDNYTTEKDKTLRIDRKTLEILMKVIASCTTYQTYFSDKLIGDLKAKPCHHCGESDIEADFEVCPSCGASLNSLSCSSCGFDLQPSFKICPKCRTPTKTKLNCWSCSEEVESDWTECPACQSFLKRPEKCCVPIKPNFAVCPKCKKKMLQETYQWNCSTCGLNFPKPTYYYTLNLRLKDATSEQWIDSFGDLGKTIFKLSCEEYKSLVDSSDSAKLRQLSDSIEFKSYYITCKPKITTYQNISKKKLTVFKIEPIDSLADARKRVKTLASILFK